MELFSQPNCQNDYCLLFYFLQQCHSYRNFGIKVVLKCKVKKLFSVQLLISNSSSTFTSYIIIHAKFDLWLLKNGFSLFCNIKPWDSFLNHYITFVQKSLQNINAYLHKLNYWILWVVLGQPLFKVQILMRKVIWRFCFSIFWFLHLSMNPGSSDLC